MKIQRIDLKAFGPFTDCVLDFDSKQSNFHIVFGQNEAGKSSSMRALSAWLFGIETKTPDDFKHAYKDMRIGGVLQNDTKSIEAIRRKGNKNTLRAADDSSVFDESLLAIFLQGIDEQSFRTRFAIDYPEMHRGGEMIKDHSSEIGQILFSAATGMGSLEEIKKQLGEEADALFTERGLKQQITVAIKEWRELEKKIKDHQLAPDFDAVHRNEIATQTHSGDKFKLQLDEIRKEKNRLQRIRDALPVISQRNMVQNNLANHKNTPDLRDDFVSLRSQHESKIQSLNQSIAKSQQTIDQAEAKIKSLKLSDLILQHESTIGKLQEKLGVYLETLPDLDEVRGQKKQNRYRVERLVKQIGTIKLDDQIEKFRLSKAETQRIRKLVETYPTIQSRLNAARQQRSELRTQVGMLQRQLGQLPEVHFSTLFAADIRSAQKLGDIDRMIAEISAESVALESEIDAAVSRLPLWDNDCEQLSRLKVPSKETIERYESRFAAVHASLDSAAQRCKDVKEQLQQASEQLQMLESSQDVPTENDLNAIRKLRDEKLGSIVGEPGEADDLTKRFAELHELIRRADEISDRLRLEADRVAEKTSLATNIDLLNEKQSSHSETLAELQEQSQELTADWAHQWSQHNIEPLSPHEMRSWCAERKIILDDVKQLRVLKTRLKELSKLRKEHIMVLINDLAGLNQPCDAKDQLLAPILQIAEDTSEEIQAKERARQQIISSIEDLENRIERTERTIESETLELVNWQEKWNDALTRLAGDKETLPDQAELLLDQNAELFAHIDENAKLDLRITGMEREVQTFLDHVQDICQSIDVPFSQDKVRDLVESLNDQLKVNREKRTRLDGLQDQVDQERISLAGYKQELAESEAMIQRLCKEANCQSISELPSVEEQFKQKAKLREELLQLDSTITAFAAGVELNKFIADAQKHDIDQLPGEIEKLQVQETETDQHCTQINQKIGELKSELRQVDGNDQLARWKSDSEFLAAKIVNDAQRYMQLRLAQKSLERIMERYREKNQSPVLALASDYFARLTLQSFAGLQVDYVDIKPILVGVRPDKKTVHVDGMSEGSRDQLYLAIRLAGLTLFLDSNQPIPLIIDDLLIKFDDERSIAALQLLCEISSKTQVIFFTHHQHVVDLATQHLGKNKINVTNL